MGGVLRSGAMDGDVPGELADFAGKMYDLARAGDAALLAYVDAGLPVNLTNATGDTLLMLAAYHGHGVLVDGLIERGADVDRLNDRGQSPLAGAVFKGEDVIVATLLAAGADADAGTPSARAAATMFGRDLVAVADKPAVVVRRIEPRDAEGFVRVFEAIADEGRWIGTELPVDDERRARWRSFALHPVDTAATWVTVDGDDVTGFLHVAVDRGRASLGMALLPQYRRRGLGRDLLAHCVDWAEASGAHKIELEVWPHNTAARRLYERAGFVVEGRRRRHWRRRSGQLWDSIEMALVLDETSPGSSLTESFGGERVDGA